MRFEVRNGSFGYKNRKILNDISFSIEDGEILSVLGSNGVGKTTLLKCMMGLLHWEKGGTYIDDVELSQIKQKEVWQKNRLCAAGKRLHLRIFGTGHGHVWKKRASWHFFTADQRGP